VDDALLEEMTALVPMAPLHQRCGLLGVCGGIASDMRELSAGPLPKAKEAIALFVRSVVRKIGALAAVLGGLDALVFTGGIGEHATEVRNAILEGCSWLGLECDNPVPLAPGSKAPGWHGHAVIRSVVHPRCASDVRLSRFNLGHTFHGPRAQQ
jgi:acetate kinase